MDEPLFSSAYSALTFAYTHSDKVYERPLMNRMADGPGMRTGRGLGGVDGAGQAGIILGKVGTLSSLHQAILLARFGPKTAVCPCCRGTVDNHDWLGIIRKISDAAASQALSTHPTARVLRDAIVARYFGKKVSLAEAASQADVSASTATNHNSAIIIWLRGSRTTKKSSGERTDGKIGEEARATAAITAILAEAGICE